MILISAYKTKYYGQFAYNLAHSIKDKMNIPICLVTDGLTGLTENDLKIFDSVKIIDMPKNPCLFKINLNKYTPFKETLYLDADMVCLNDFSLLIEKIKQHPIYVDTLGSGSFWLKDEAFSKPFQDVNTSIFYFTKESDDYFKELNKVYKKIDKTLFKAMWGKDKLIPDEALHSLVLSETEALLPILGGIHYCDKVKHASLIVKDYFISMYGFRIAKQDTKELYDKVMSGVMKRAGLENRFKIQPLYSNKFIGL